MRQPLKSVWLALALLGSAHGLAQAKAPDWKGYARKSDDWYRSAEGMRIAKNILSHQAPAGDWPKNGDTASEPYVGSHARLKGTFDNGASINEVRFLARAYLATHKSDDRDAVLRAIDHILQAQYPSGGWPQSSPPGTKYPRYITFNDNTMVNLMTLLRDVATSDQFQFVDDAKRKSAQKAFDAGIACILKSQVVVDGKKTVWCAQHDEVTLEPRPARSFELVSLSGSESAGILTLLMTLDRPGPEVVDAIKAGVAWFDAVKQSGFAEVVVRGDKVLIANPTAPPLWARFYEIGTNRPIFSGRDGVKTYDIAQIEAERRNGYAWYGHWGTGLAERYKRWSTRQAKLTGKS